MIGLFAWIIFLGLCVYGNWVFVILLTAPIGAAILYVGFGLIVETIEDKIHRHRRRKRWEKIYGKKDDK